MNQHFTQLELLLRKRSIKFRFRYVSSVNQNLANFRPIEAMPHISPRAVFLINGADDWTGTNPDDARALYAAAGEPKELWIVPGAGHGGAFHVARQEYQERLLAFFDQHLK